MVLYEDYILHDYEKDCLFLTARDIEYINKEIENVILQLEKSYDEMQNYYNIIKKVSDMKESLNSLSKALGVMERQLTKVKLLRKICNSEISKSPVFSNNILEYLHHMGYLQEDRELTEMFYRKVANDDE